MFVCLQVNVCLLAGQCLFAGQFFFIDYCFVKNKAHGFILNINLVSFVQTEGTDGKHDKCKGFGYKTNCFAPN